MTKVKRYDVESSIMRAYFLRYGYIALIFTSALVVYISGINKYFFLVPIGITITMSVHLIISAYFEMDHFICAFQNSHHSVMDPTVKYSKFELKKMKRDYYGIALIFIIFSLALILVLFEVILW